MMTRRLLKYWRQHFVFEVEREGQRLTTRAGFFEDGTLAEIFLTSSKPGSSVATGEHLETH